jgi:pimeloyl-ACP methyl ester carboxylesterase
VSVYRQRGTVLIAGTGIALALALGALFVLQRSLLFFPTHDPSEPFCKTSGLTHWVEDGQYVGEVRSGAATGRVWLYAHGSGGQAARTGYILPHFLPEDTVYIVEYPGYGDKGGSPSERAINAAVLGAYRALAARFGAAQIHVLGESLGSGPAAYLGSVDDPPGQIDLVVPYDDITAVAQERYPLLPIRALMRDRWYNSKALSHYTGHLEIFGARQDEVIPVHHAQALAAQLPKARYREMDTGHFWADKVDVIF